MAYIHGGDVYGRRIEHDFSVNVNYAFGYKDNIKGAIIKALERLEQYPPYDSTALEERLAEALGVDKASLVMTAGASQAFMLIVETLGFETATIFYPGFYGYEYALNAKNIAIKYTPYQDLFDGKYDIEKEYTDVIFIANPNNPTGGCLSEDYLIRLVEGAQLRGITVVIDECFLTLSGRGRESFMFKDYQNVIVVRSFTKTFGIPAVRLGYIFTKNESQRAAIKRHIPEWNLSSMAIAAGLSAIEGAAGLEADIRLISAERFRLVAALKKEGYEVFDSEANYILFKSQDNFLYDRLLAKGILIRDCSNFRGLGPGYYRIAVKGAEENNILIEAINE